MPWQIYASAHTAAHILRETYVLAIKASYLCTRAIDPSAAVPLALGQLLPGSCMGSGRSCSSGPALDGGRAIVVQCDIWC